VIVSNRTTNTLVLTVVVDPDTAVIHDEKYKGATGESWTKGALLMGLEGGQLAAIAETVDSNLTGPVFAIANEDYDAATDGYASVREIGSETRLDGQIATGSATEDDIGKRGRLLYDATTKMYRVDLSTAVDAAIEVTDVEVRHQPFGTYADGNYNLVTFKFLSAVLDTAPASVS
jgi:hypothetical protein